MTEIIVTSRERLEKYPYIPSSHFSVISITDPDEPLVRLPSNSVFSPVLRLKFHDTDKEKDEWINRFNKLETIYGITNIQAYEISEFVKENWNSSDYMIVQCEAGISRSAGVAAAIAKWAFGDDVFYFKKYIPNRRCYNMVLRELIG